MTSDEFDKLRAGSTIRQCSEIEEGMLARIADLENALSFVVEALDQLLDDMGDDGLSVCQAAKDQAKSAFEKARVLMENGQ